LVERGSKLADFKKLYLKRGREKPVRHYHPWIFSGAVKYLEGEPSSGETVMVVDAAGDFLAWGAYSPNSQIRVRIWSWAQDQKINQDYFRTLILGALDYRKRIDYRYPMRRLIHGESDGLPGLIADQYGDVLVLQLLSSGVEFWKDDLIQIIAEETNCRTIFERSDVQVRKLEGLPLRTGTLYGPEPASLVEVDENSFKYLIDVTNGHKTGYYLDQRENRVIIGEMCSGKTVLDCFCYTGGFSLQALKNNAQNVTLIDESDTALVLAEKHIKENQLDLDAVTIHQGDVFKVLRKFRDQAASFDVIILDPPKFAPTASHVDRAARGYKDINLLAFKLLNPGGLLATFSCSGGITREFFLRVLSGAAQDAGVNARIQLHMGQSADHSSNLSFPEGNYLKGFGIRVG
jgi:23S rRNA (cytosine1962-C5)-methyltransferase